MQLQRVNGNFLCRALAITLVVANHSSGWYFGGGMHFLMLLAGYNLAAFSFNKTELAICNDLWRMVAKITLPAMLIILAYAGLKQEFNWRELMLVSNLLTTPDHLYRIAELPVWYCQVLWQMALLITPLLLILPFNRQIKLRPLRFILLLFCLTLLLNLSANVDYPWQRLPQLYLWNFVLGWLIWALLNKQSQLAKWQASALLLISFSLVFLTELEQKPELIYRFLIASGLSLSFVWLSSFWLPRILAICINLVANATLTIFLFHLSFIALYQTYWQSVTPTKLDVIAQFSFAIFCSCLLWLIGKASINAIKQYRLSRFG